VSAPGLPNSSASGRMQLGCNIMLRVVSLLRCGNCHSVSHGFETALLPSSTVRFGAVLILANWPYTFIAVTPTNKKLEAIDVEAPGSTSRTLVETWGRLHAVRTSLGVAATLAYLWALA
jgi:Domain of unknown function (DUF1772)